MTALGSRLDALIDAQEACFVARMPRSRALTEEAEAVLPGGVASSWQSAPPQAVWISHGQGSHVFDVDGTEYVDLHNGFGAMLVGHAHPAIVGAVSDRVRLGTHFSQPTEDLIVVARALADRFGLPRWRFGNSGTEATMDAVHLMRLATGRPKIVKVEGTYHGHHDSVQVSVYPEPDDMGERGQPRSVGEIGDAVPAAITDLTVVVPFADLEALDRVFVEHRDEIAGLIIEPWMMNVGMIAPPDGYLEGIREITRRHGALLTFDEVKTGLTVAPGGVTEISGVIPDLVTLAKAMGGGLPCGAIGGSRAVMGLIADGSYEQVGTFNGNPLTMAAARATLTEVLTPDAYAHLTRLREQMAHGAQAALDHHGVPGYVNAVGAKGVVVFSPTRLRDYRDFLGYDSRWGHAHWLFQHNGGVFLPPWGKVEQWTLSVQHSDADAARFVTNVDRFLAAVTGLASQNRKSSGSPTPDSAQPPAR
jgi:glutamate-1-semialdehyde 2,1-aminomutase